MSAFPPTINNYIAPVRPSPPRRPQTYATVGGAHLSVDLEESAGRRRRPSGSFGAQVGKVVSVHVLDKQEADDHIWFQIQLAAALDVVKDGQPATLPAATQCWIVAEETQEPTLTQKLVLNKGPSRVGGGLEWVAAPWDLFRHELVEFESANSGLTLNERITKLRQIEPFQKSSLRPGHWSPPPEPPISTPDHLIRAVGNFSRTTKR